MRTFLRFILAGFFPEQLYPEKRQSLKALCEHGCDFIALDALGNLLVRFSIFCELAIVPSTFSVGIWLPLPPLVVNNRQV